MGRIPSENEFSRHGVPMKLRQTSLVIDLVPRFRILLDTDQAQVIGELKSFNMLYR